MESIYNYLIITDTRKKYLVSLRDYSDQSHMGEFLANKISDIIEQLGSEKFAAVVTDAASNCNVAQRKTQEMYPHIWNVWCTVHAINLIAADLVQFESIKKLINDCRKINHFFKTSHSSHSLLTKGFVDMKIKGSGLKTWVKTHWGSLYLTTDSILHTRPVFDWVSIY